MSSFIDNLINVIGKANSAINSIKGIESKIARLNYDNLIDALGEAATEAREELAERRKALEDQVSSATKVNEGWYEGNDTKNPIVLTYPQHDLLENYIIFSTRPRRPREGNFLSTNSEYDGVAIRLYIPDALISQANVTYAAKDMGVGKQGLAKIIDAASNDTDGDFMETVGNEAANIIKAAGQGALNKLTGDISNFVQGRAVNPMQEQMLDGVAFRSFNFTYDFYPKSADEARVVNQIIFAFRAAMLPDTFSSVGGSESENFFNYPNIFDVEFDGPIESKVDGFLPMVMTKCDVDHTGGQKFSTHMDGQPMKSTITMEFLEIKILSQDNYLAISPHAADFGQIGEESQSILEDMADRGNQDRGDT